MARVTIKIESDDINETDIEVVETSIIRSTGTSDIADVPNVLGRAVQRALRAATGVDRYQIDGYPDAAWTIVSHLNINAKPE